MHAEAALFAALGDDTRLAVVTQLCDGPASIVELTEGRAMTRQAVTKHLRVLEGAGLVDHARLGRTTVWRLRAARLAEARRYLDEISQQWDDRLAALKALVEG